MGWVGPRSKKGKKKENFLQKIISKKSVILIFRKFFLLNFA
jgi:hypothetical protein